MSRLILYLLFLLVTYIVGVAFGFELENPEDILLKSDVRMIGPIVDMSRVKIAVIDEGFQGFSRFSKSLGANVSLVGEEAQNGNYHGLALAQEILAASGAMSLPDPQKRPKITLLQAAGYSQLEKAVDYCIKNKIQIILYSTNWEWSTNFDGTGFINQLATKASDHKILWINSAGNNGGLSYTSPITITNSKDKHIELPDSDNTLLFTNSLDDNLVNITLSWNDYKDINYATKKDLDFVLYKLSDEGDFIEVTSSQEVNGKKVIVHYGQKKQAGIQPEEDQSEEYSGNARESAEVPLSKGQYALKIFYDGSKKQFSENDIFRVILRSQKPNSIKMKSATNKNEITAPADNPKVISVGLKEASFSAVGPTIDGRIKPDVVLDLNANNLLLKFSDGNQKSPDTSDAAAIFTGIIVAMKSQRSQLNFKEIKTYLNYLSQLQNPSLKLEATYGYKKINSSSNKAPVWQMPTSVELFDSFHH